MYAQGASFQSSQVSTTNTAHLDANTISAPMQGRNGQVSKQGATANNYTHQTVATEERRSTKTRFTMEEIAKHNTVDSCWIVAHGNVYDATNFLSLHPAGAKPLLSRAGNIRVLFPLL